MEIHLAERLGVSRTPIREAIRKLELEGLEVMIPHRGAVVASITEKDMKDVLEVRRTLEILAGEVACERITPELLEELKRAEQEFSSLKKTDNARLIHILNNQREQMYRYRLEYLKDRGSRERLDREHQAIYMGIQNGDKKAVSAAVCIHIDNQEAAILAGIREQQE